MLERNKIYNMDCIEGMKKIDNDSIDFVFCDPPYGVALDEKAKETIKTFRNSTKNTIITSEWDKFEDYELFCHNWISEAVRVLKPKGWLCIWNDFRRIGVIQKVCESYGMRFADLFTWAKPNAPLGFPDGFTKACEFCLIFNKTSKDTDYKRYMSKDIHRDFLLHSITSNEERKEASHHPTVKPKDVLYPFIDKFSQKGDVVLDPFCGSGSIPVACIEKGRHFIAFELNEQYYAESINRLETTSNRVRTRLSEWLK